MRRERNFIGPAGMGGMVSLWGASSLIKSVQRGTCAVAAGATTGTSTITVVDTANCSVRFLGFIDPNNGDGTTNPDVHFTRITLTNSTTLTATRATSDATYGRTVRFEVIEFLPGLLRSVQRGIVTLPGNASSTTTITSVNTDKTVMGFLGFTTNFGSASNNLEGLDVALTNATTVTGTVGNGTATGIVSFEALEFF